MSDNTVSESDLMAMAAHLHVQLRRHTGRVTDVEWMVQDREYAAAIINLAKAQALTRGAPEMAIWAQRFERALVRVQRPRRPLLSALAIRGAEEERQVAAPAALPDSGLHGELGNSVITEFGDAERSVDTSDLPARAPAPPQRYVWSLR